MKKTIILSALALTTFIAKAQTEKNNWIVGGALAFTSSTQKEADMPGSASSTAVALSPSAGYFFINNLAAGASINLTSAHSSNSNSGSTSSSTVTLFSAGPFVRYYFNGYIAINSLSHLCKNLSTEKQFCSKDQ